MPTEPLLSPETVVLTDSWPPAKSTFVRAATLTSSSRSGSRGSTRTAVSVRSVAVTRTRAPATTTVAAMGSGVSKVGMTALLLSFDGSAGGGTAAGQARLLNVARDQR